MYFNDILKIFIANKITPLYVAVDREIPEIVKMLLAKPEIRINEKIIIKKVKTKLFYEIQK